MKKNILISMSMVMLVCLACADDEVSPNFDSGNLITFYDDNNNPTGEFLIQVMGEQASDNFHGFNLLVKSGKEGRLKDGTYRWNPSLTAFTVSEFSILDISKHTQAVSSCGGFVETDTLEVSSAKLIVKHTEPDPSLQQIEPVYEIAVDFVAGESTNRINFSGYLHAITYIGIRPK